MAKIGHGLAGVALPAVVADRKGDNTAQPRRCTACVHVKHGSYGNRNHTDKLYDALAARKVYKTQSVTLVDQSLLLMPEAMDVTLSYWAASRQFDFDILNW